MSASYLKIPVEMAVMALREHVVPQCKTFVVALFLFPGKANLNDGPAQRIADEIGIQSRTVYRHWEWLLDRDWMGKDFENGWYFLRGFDWIHSVEGWKYSRAALMQKEDLPHVKAFFIGAVLTSIVRTGTGAGTERKRRCSEQSRYPVSLSTIQKAFGVSRDTAYRYRKLANKRDYVKMSPNLQQVAGITPKDITHLKQNNVESVRVNLFGTTKSIEVKPDQLRTDYGFVYVQLPNFITPNIQLKKRNR